MSHLPARLDLAKLSVFLEAARSGGYTAAARRLHVTPSAVSHAVRKLETGIGRTLVEWRGRSLVLTADGEYIRQVCQRVFDELGDAEQSLSTSAAGGTQAVTIGATVEFGATVLVQKLRPLLEATPWLRADFHLSDDLTQSLLQDEIDLAVDCAVHTHPSIQRTDLFREKYVLVASPSFLATRAIRQPADLERVPVLSFDKDGRWWNHLLRALPGRRRPSLERIVEINQVRGMVRAAVEGYGVALIPKYAVMGDLARGTLLLLFPRLRLLEDWFCVYQKRSKAGREKNRLVTEFLLRLDVSEFGDAIRQRATTS
jgi:LysR family transcriptional regulator for metE and metH